MYHCWKPLHNVFITVGNLFFQIFEKLKNKNNFVSIFQRDRQENDGNIQKTGKDGKRKYVCFMYDEILFISLIEIHC